MSQCRIDSDLPSTGEGRRVAPASRIAKPAAATARPARCRHTPDASEVCRPRARASRRGSKAGAPTHEPSQSGLAPLIVTVTNPPSATGAVEGARRVTPERERGRAEIRGRQPGRVRPAGACSRRAGHEPPMRMAGRVRRTGADERRPGGRRRHGHVRGTLGTRPGLARNKRLVNTASRIADNAHYVK